MPLFDERILRDIAQPESFRRGRGYVSDVEKVHISRTTDGYISIKGDVYGSYRYKVSFTLSPDGSKVTSYECSCPYDFGGACKHVVALGLVALRRKNISSEASVVDGQNKLDEEAELLTVLRDFAIKNGTSLTERQIQDLAKRLKKLPIRQGFPRTVVSKPLVAHPLDHIEIAFSYEHKEDLIHASTAAVYGPVVYELEGFQALNGEKNEREYADRDWEEERRAVDTLRQYGFRRDDVQHGFTLEAEQAIIFIEYGLPNLADQYRVLYDDAFLALSRVKESSVSSEFDILDGKNDWLSFSLDWKCADRELTPQEISDLALGWKTHIRLADGAFVRVVNALTIKRVQATIGDDTNIGRQKISRARAIELALLCEEDVTIRLARTEESVGAFLRDAKNGRLLSEPVVPKKLGKTLRPYQREALSWIAFLRRYKFGGVLADDMGLGETLQALATLVTERPKNAPPSLVICPKTLIPVWLSEAKRFVPSLKVRAIEGTASERKVALLKHAENCNLLVTSYSLFQRDVKLYRAYEFYYAILDEAQYVKNPKSNTAAAVKTIRAQHRLALTGTPLENGVHELWSLFDFLMPGLLGDHTSFRQQFENPIRIHGDVDALATLKRRVKPFLLRRTKESVAPELPPRIEQTDVCPLTQTQAALYADVLASVRA